MNQDNEFGTYIEAENNVDALLKIVEKLKSSDNKKFRERIEKDASLTIKIREGNTVQNAPELPTEIRPPKN